jgi:hypothetical protein
MVATQVATKTRHEQPEAKEGFSMNSRRLCLRSNGMTAAGGLLMLAMLFLPRTAHAVGFAHDDNFIVFAPDQALAEGLLVRANSLRREIATEWFGEQLPTGAGRTVVHLRLSEADDRGTIWPKDPKDAKQTLHNVWVTTTPDRVDALLKHELTHAVFATKFPERIPRWIEEGIASLADDAGRAASRDRLLAQYVRSGDWPALKPILEANRIRSTDDAAYSAAPSVIRYLLSRADKRTLVRFALLAKNEGLEAALRQCYGFRGLDEFQVAWQAWVGQRSEIAFQAVDGDGERRASASPYRRAF